jgi:hypothetical protein
VDNARRSRIIGPGLTGATCAFYYISNRLGWLASWPYDGFMQLTDDDIREFADICEREFGVRQTPDEARIAATLLLDLCFVIVQPLPGEPGYAGQPQITL